MGTFDARENTADRVLDGTDGYCLPACQVPTCIFSNRLLKGLGADLASSEWVAKAPAHMAVLQRGISGAAAKVRSWSA